MMFRIWAFPFGLFLCVAAVQLLRKHWHKALSSALAAGIFLALMAIDAQSHRNAMLRARVHKLTEQLNNQPGTSNKSVERDLSTRRFSNGGLTNGSQ